MDASDPFYDVGYLSATTNIEPLLGIALACLPITRSIMVSFHHASSQLFLKLSTFGTSHASKFSRGSSSAKDSALERGEFGAASSKSASERKKFTRLYDHLYPMSNMETTATMVDADDEGRAYARAHAHAGQDKRAILVEQKWEVARDAESGRSRASSATATTVERKGVAL